MPGVGVECLIRPHRGSVISTALGMVSTPERIALLKVGCGLATDGRSLQRFLFLPENVWKWRSILLSLYLITKSVSLSVAKESEKGRKSEERGVDWAQAGVEALHKLCTGPAPHRALLIALKVTSLGGWKSR